MNLYDTFMLVGTQNLTSPPFSDGPFPCSGPSVPTEENKVAPSINRDTVKGTQCIW